MSKYLIFGATGAIGSNLAQHLHESNEEIHLISRNRDKLEDLSKRLGLPQKLREVDIPKEACEKMARDAMKQTRLLVNNPREVTEEDALNIYQSAW